MQKIIGVIVGIILIAAGIFLYIKNEHLAKVCTKEAEALVVDMKQDMQSDENGITYMYYPIIEYEVNGSKVKSTFENGSSTPAYAINTKLTILYNPDKVEEFIVKGEGNNQIFSIVFIALGVIVTIGGIYVLLKKD